MLKFISLSSGSKGNAAFVETDNVRLLIDAGLSCSALKKELENYNLTLNDFNGILITHIHSDHTKGLAQIVKQSHLPVLIPSKMKKEILTLINNEYIEIIDDYADMLDLNINLLYTSHDTDCSVGYIFESYGSSLVYITDTGYINRKILKCMENKDCYFLESNHDEQMLMDGPYPHHLKQRVISDSGHLSNNMTAKYLSTIIGDKTKYIILAHVSQHNNTYELAYNTVKEKLDEINYKGKILVAKQNEATDFIEV